MIEAAMKPLLPNRIAAASIAEGVAKDLASAADHLDQMGRTVIAQALLEQARRHRVQAIRLRALAAADRYATIAKPR
jgi:hypothetical protein